MSVIVSSAIYKGLLEENDLQYCNFYYLKEQSLAVSNHLKLKFNKRAVFYPVGKIANKQSEGVQCLLIRHLN